MVSMVFKITVDRESCIGCGACAAACDNFKLVDGKSMPIKTEVANIGCSKEAADICPVGAIKIEKK